jgi:hypothetical protein
MGQRDRVGTLLEPCRPPTGRRQDRWFDLPPRHVAPGGSGSNVAEIFDAFDDLETPVAADAGAFRALRRDRRLRRRPEAADRP